MLQDILYKRSARYKAVDNDNVCQFLVRIYKTVITSFYFYNLNTFMKFHNLLHFHQIELSIHSDRFPIFFFFN